MIQVRCDMKSSIKKNLHARLFSSPIPPSLFHMQQSISIVFDCCRIFTCIGGRRGLNWRVRYCLIWNINKLQTVRFLRHPQMSLDRSATENHMARSVLKGCHWQTVMEKIQGVLLAVAGLNTKIATANDTLIDSTIRRKDASTRH